ncbi:MAG TPA: ABC transporter ATP-binding protein [Burkholderiaceae bacterium]
MLDEPTALALADVDKAFAARGRRRQVLAGVHLRAAAGELVAITGPNGAGKSTVLRLVAGLLLPDAGTVRVADRRGCLCDPAGQPGLVSAVFDGSRGLYWKLTVAENLRYFASLDGLSGPAAMAAAAPWLERFGLEARQDDLVQNLSKGTQQKVSIVRALALAKPVLLFDEPTVLLDEDACWQLAQSLKSLCRQGHTVVVATHDRDFVGLTQARQVRVVPEGGLVAAAVAPVRTEAATLLH